MIVSVEEFRKYNGVNDDDTGFLVSFIRSAEEVVADYLGYRPEYQLRTETLDGTGMDYMPVNAGPIRSVAEVTIGGAGVALRRIGFQDYKVFLTEGIFPEGRRNVRLRYTAGYRFGVSAGEVAGGTADGAGVDALSGGTADTAGADGTLQGGDAASFSGEPAFLIKNVVLRIASLMLTETGQNIGITSKSFEDSGMRTFINNTDYSRYLLPIAKHKLLVI